NQLTFTLKRYSHTKDRVGVGVVRGAVERVDYPLPIALALDDNRVARLFRQNAVPRIVRTDPLGDQSLGGKICLGHQVNVTLLGNGSNSAELFEQNAPGIAGSLHCKIEHVLILVGSDECRKFGLWEVTGSGRAQGTTSKSVKNSTTLPSASRPRYVRYVPSPHPLPKIMRLASASGTKMFAQSPLPARRLSSIACITSSLNNEFPCSISAPSFSSTTMAVRESIKLPVPVST